jgi:hypothetical protein
VFALFQMIIDGTCEFLRAADSERTALIMGKSLSVATGLPILAASNLSDGSTSVRFRFERGKAINSTARK